MQKIVLTGNLTRNLEIKETESGKTIAKFNIAVRRPYSKDATDFFDVVAWGNLAEICGKYLEKGKKVAVVGYMTSRTYEKDGQTRKIWEVYAEDVEFLSSNLNGNSNNDDNEYFKGEN